MGLSRKVTFRASSALAMVGAALAVAACGGSSSSHSSTHAASSTPAPTNAAATSVMVKTAHGSKGTYLVGPNGRALYLWIADSSNKSVCSGSCAKAWPPLIAKGKPAASGGAMAADLGTTTRSDGSKQVTYNGHPLYYFVGDTSSGTTHGQGSNGFGAKWWLVSTSGQPITRSGSSGSSSSSSSSSASGGSSTSSSGGGWG